MKCGRRLEVDLLGIRPAKLAQRPINIATIKIEHVHCTARRKISSDALRHGSASRLKGSGTQRNQNESLDPKS
eukprot:365440-Chlamydomonas_euryale.AAC.3